jgi:hypothetical protein
MMQPCVKIEVVIIIAVLLLREFPRPSHNTDIANKFKLPGSVNTQYMSSKIRKNLRLILLLIS